MKHKFNLSHTKLSSFNMGELIPIGCEEVLPGDVFQHKVNSLIRMSPMVAPVMHPTHAQIFHFFVPNRILWDDWEDFITGGADGNDDSEFPTITVPANSSDSHIGSLADHFGCPPSDTDYEVNALPFRAYASIVNEYFRDQDLQGELPLSLESGLDDITNLEKFRQDWAKDYFTTSRPFQQKGDTVTVPILGSAPIFDTGSAGSRVTLFSDGENEERRLDVASDGAISIENASTTSSQSLFADMSAVTGIDIVTLRQAFSEQRFKELRARFGSRYTEYLQFLGVRSDDARLQRPEYLAGGKQTIQFSEVLSSANIGSGGQNTDLGSMGGHGIGAIRSNTYRRFFKEHGFVISLMAVKPKAIYQNGLPRKFTRTIKEDFWQREYQHVGQQPIYNNEVFIDSSDRLGTFGYQDRYSEYRSSPSHVSGEFRTTLQYWHMARDFASEPALNSSFVSCVPSNRIFADQTSDQLYVMSSHNLKAKRLVTNKPKGASF
ncbi:major capsid protein [Microviridae sp.]|nr:major capsid protein [Microviridae sp.]